MPNGKQVQLSVMRVGEYLLGAAIAALVGLTVSFFVVKQDLIFYKDALGEAIVSVKANTAAIQADRIVDAQLRTRFEADIGALKLKLTSHERQRLHSQGIIEFERLRTEVRIQLDRMGMDMAIPPNEGLPP